MDIKKIEDVARDKYLELTKGLGNASPEVQASVFSKLVASAIEEYHKQVSEES